MANKIIFLGCLSNKNYQSSCKNAIKIIQFLDDDFHVIDDPPCCGALAYNITPDEIMIKHVEFVNEWFKRNNVDELVTTCAGCYSYFIRYYTEFLGSEFKVKVQHLLQLMAKPENLKKLNLRHSGKKFKVNYHDACHLRNSSVPIMEEPRIILDAIENIQLNELDFNKKSSLCCGAGGGVYSIFKENSDFSAKAIFENMNKSKTLLTACPFCYTALKRIKKINQIKKNVFKFEDFIVNLMEGADQLK